ncbi:Small subunit (SSU) processome component [Coemansia sp. RSA 2322]|nr:Small subunit (SSU) processome component [Coemansia sp. RSA 2322]
MPKKTTTRRKSQQPQPAASAAVVAHEADRWTWALDGDGGDDSLLAVVRNTDRLRIVDVHTGAMRSEHACASAIRAVAWGRLESDARARLAAAALQNGSVAVVSPARNAVIATLSGAHTAAVVDVAFGGGSLFSLDSDGVIMQWDVAAARPAQRLPSGVSGACRLLASNDGSRVVVASHRVELWDVARKARVAAWPGHASPVHTLCWAADETAVVSAAADDRTVLVWDAASSASTAARAVLAADADVSSIDVSPAGSVLAVGCDGAVSAWFGAATSTSKTANPMLGVAPDTVARVISAADATQRLLVRGARFSRVAGDEGSALLVRGTPTAPQFEVVALADRDGRYEPSVELHRQPHAALIRNAADAEAAITHVYSEVGATVTSPATEAARAAAQIPPPVTPSLADRMRQLTVATPGAGPASSASNAAVTSRLPAGTLVRVLVQSLHTADQVMLDSVLDNSARSLVVRDTVLGLPPAYVLPLLQQLLSRFHASPAGAVRLLPWIRNTLAMHSAYLTSIPSLVPQLAGFYHAIEARLETHRRLLKLSGRLELANIQIRARAHHQEQEKAAANSTQKQAAMDPINVYRESDDEDEDEDDDTARRASTEPPTPVWQAEESTDDEQLSSGAENAAEDDQWSEDDDEDDEDKEMDSGEPSDSDDGTSSSGMETSGEEESDEEDL